MALLGLSRRSLRDISGNLVPFSILLFFVVWFALERTWGWDLFSAVVVFGLLLSLAGSLFAVTYAAAVLFQRTDPDR